MRRGWFWAGFGALLIGCGAFVGWAPDLRLAAERRAARAEGLLGPDPAATAPSWAEWAGAIARADRRLQAER